MTIDALGEPDHSAAQIRATIDRLGIPGLFDVHTHFLPPRVQAKVQAVFDSAGPMIGRPWPIRYRGDEQQMLGWMRSFGVRWFSALPYAHKPGMAEFLNDWAAEFAARTPDALHCGTFFPEPGAADYVRARLDAGLELMKVHVQVGAFAVNDPLLEDTWGLLAEASTPIVVHAGSGPVPGEFTGPAPVAALLARHPRLRILVAHAGAPEYGEFLELAERYPHVALDTTMVFTDFFQDAGPYPADLYPRLLELGLGGKVLLGSDFPNIPYPYAHQIEAIERLDLGEEFLARVLWHNGAELFDRPSAP